MHIPQDHGIAVSSAGHEVKCKVVEDPENMM